MAYTDLRDFLATLDREGQLLNYSEQVAPEPGLGAAARATANVNRPRTGAAVRQHQGLRTRQAVVVSRDPDDPDDFGKQNVGIYRIQVKDKDRLGSSRWRRTTSACTCSTPRSAGRTCRSRSRSAPNR